MISTLWDISSWLLLVGKSLLTVSPPKAAGQSNPLQESTEKFKFTGAAVKLTVCIQGYIRKTSPLLRQFLAVPLSYFFPMHIHGSMHTTHKLQHLCISRMQMCSSYPACAACYTCVCSPFPPKFPRTNKCSFSCFLFKGQEGLDGERGKPGQQGLPVRDAALL